ncbi:GDP-mannose 4,6-dehydratase [Candidatus Deferrimicrobium sp.]|uniref:GDP-mannose 4,6-dehydratase n=1 Tax=Candidatus Deferrimicrobium sp. TaxID=3060586 RepID=UPI0027204F89|nr:GDP-mannose 4,6-dehydratase [Candidatus Deferrimicrobium sp.]MDO8738900.1 GDP-mannose 4,6-dehydratase [Candidatus Deferrimicrobium sp.]
MDTKTHNSPRTALITGIGGQDGSYLTEFLLEKGYRVVGTVPDAAPADIGRIRHMRDRIEIVQDDLLDQDRIEKIFLDHQPDEAYNFAANSVLAASFQRPILATMVLAMGVTRILEAIRKVTPKARFFQASSSEIFGKPAEVPQSETTPFHPRNPYGVSKVYGHLMAMTYRENYGLYACSGILYNHESPRRSPEFVTRKITRAAAMIKLGLSKELRLGNLKARRDWGFAGDYVRAMWLMLQQPQPDDYVLATGETHSVRELCEEAFSYVGLDYREYVVLEAESFRTPETSQLVGNPEKAHRLLGWETTVSFRELVRMMVDADLEALRLK